jgi:hypothetical protein
LEPLLGRAQPSTFGGPTPCRLPDRSLVVASAVLGFRRTGDWVPEDRGAAARDMGVGVRNMGGGDPADRPMALGEMSSCPRHRVPRLWGIGSTALGGPYHDARHMDRWPPATRPWTFGTMVPGPRWERPRPSASRQTALDTLSHVSRHNVPCHSDPCPLPLGTLSHGHRHDFWRLAGQRRSKAPSCSIRWSSSRPKGDLRKGKQVAQAGVCMLSGGLRSRSAARLRDADARRRGVHHGRAHRNDSHLFRASGARPEMDVPRWAYTPPPATCGRSPRCPCPAGRRVRRISYRTLLPDGTSRSKVHRASTLSALAARIMPWEMTPRILAGFRLAK